MNKARILVVDDSVVVRRTVSDELARDPALEVVGTAANGKIALAKIPQVNPDIVILDVGMPEMDGLETLVHIRKSYPKLPVIMFSSLTERGAIITLEALSLGASDYFAKPSNSVGLDASLKVIREELVPSIKALCRIGSPVSTPPRLATRPVANGKIEVVAIATSTGGPNALTEIFRTIPASFPLPFVIVQHMPPMFTKLLAERMSAQCPIRFHEAVPGDVLKPGQAWIAPGNFHMTVSRVGLQVQVQTNQNPPENSCRPAADVLFRSVAETFGPAALCVVLTGMGRDGLRGCETICEAGGQVIAQDEATSVVWGMPGFVTRAGLASTILPLSQIAGEINRRVTGKPST
ncbi:MAG: chemotaxis response regulator protein-glutamate methylesterase [Bryobacteraceae bacterium]